MNVFLISVTLVSLFIYYVVQSVFLFLIPKKFRKKKDIAGKNILITGAGNGLGRQLAIEFSKHSTCLILLDINKVALKETEQLVSSSSRTFIYECDITNRKKVYSLAERIKDEVGDVDILVNNAGTVCGKSLIDLPDEEIQKTMEVNALSHFWLCKSFLPAMMARNSGHIVTIASVAGHTGVPKLTDYCASKYAAVGFAESLELELRLKKLDGIKVTIVSPAHINTGLFDGMKMTIGSTLNAENVAEEVVSGVLEEKEAIFVPYYFSYIFMLKSIVPRWMHIAFFEMTENIKAMDSFTGRPSIRGTENHLTRRT